MTRGEPLENRIIDILRGSEGMPLADLTRALEVADKKRSTVLAALNRLKEQGVVEQLADKMWQLPPVTETDERILRAYADLSVDEKATQAALKLKLRGRDLDELLKGLVAKGHLHAPRPRYSQSGILGGRSSRIGLAARGAVVGGLLAGFATITNLGRHRLTRTGAAIIGVCPDCGQDLQDGDLVIVDPSWQREAPIAASHVACRNLGHRHDQGPFCAACGLSPTLAELLPRALTVERLRHAFTLHEQHTYDELKRLAERVTADDIRHGQYVKLVDTVIELGNREPRKGAEIAEDEARFAQRDIRDALRGDLAKRDVIEELVRLMHAAPTAHRKALPPEDWRKRADVLWQAAHDIRTQELASIDRVRSTAQGLSGALFHHAPWPPPLSTSRDRESRGHHDEPITPQAVMIRIGKSWYHHGCHLALHGETPAKERPKK